jgi:hypothetical protein
MIAGMSVASSTSRSHISACPMPMISPVLLVPRVAPQISNANIFVFHPRS